MCCYCRHPQTGTDLERLAIAKVAGEIRWDNAVFRRSSERATRLSAENPNALTNSV